MVDHTMPYGPRREITCLRGLRTTRPRTACRLATCYSIVSVAEGTGLSLALLETLNTGFVASRPIYQ